jgi:hypothetical protein
MVTVHVDIGQCCLNPLGRPWRPDEKRYCKLVFIGKNLDRKELTDAFNACMVTNLVDEIISSVELGWCPTGFKYLGAGAGCGARQPLAARI